ncbi:MAG: hypothetical protein Q9187_008533 [Circinaria calcarea]
MADDLLSAIESVHISSREKKDLCEDSLKAFLLEPRPQKKLRPIPGKLKQQLEDEFLSPPTTFSAEWLNRLQQTFSNGANADPHNNTVHSGGS